MLHAQLKEDVGLWFYPGVIMIQSGLAKVTENRTILHEWLHAYEDLIVYPHENLAITQASRSPEVIIEAYARWHHQQNHDLVKYIRNYFKENGF